MFVVSGSVVVIKFGNFCYCFFEWVEVKVVVIKFVLYFVDKLIILEDVVFYIDEDEWLSWKKIGDSVLYIELCRWVDIMVIVFFLVNIFGKVSIFNFYLKFILLLNFLVDKVI